MRTVQVPAHLAAQPEVKDRRLRVWEALEDYNSSGALRTFMADHGES